MSTNHKSRLRIPTLRYKATPRQPHGDQVATPEVARYLVDLMKVEEAEHARSLLETTLRTTHFPAACLLPPLRVLPESMRHSTLVHAWQGGASLTPA